jgi:hypothetical protein
MSGRKFTAEESDRFQINVGRIVQGRRVSQEDLIRSSVVTIPEEGADQLRTLLEHIFRPDDWVEFVPAALKEEGQKPSPAPRGTITKVGQLDSNLDELLQHSVGTFLRINPVRQSPSGPTKSTDIVRFQHLLIEHDNLTKEDQAALLASLELPIAVIIDSGGKSLHAWLSMNMKSNQRGNFMLAARRIMALLKPLGFDLSNSDSSRLSRAPGFKRTDDLKKGATLQRLLYLNPKVKWDTPPIMDVIEAARKAIPAEPQNQ